MFAAEEGEAKDTFVHSMDDFIGGTDDAPEPIYDLYSVINHFGALGMGKTA